MMIKSAKHASVEDQLHKILAEKGFVLPDEDRKATIVAWNVLTSMATVLGGAETDQQHAYRDD